MSCDQKSLVSDRTTAFNDTQAPDDDGNIAIHVAGLGKCYQVYSRPRDRLLQMLFRGRRQYFRDFWALQNISFTVRKGETVGIIGRNGSGKSTLLQIISGTLTPTCGEIYTRGRIAALLELGSGFNPEFSGRENVFFNASILGLSRAEIIEKFDDIVEFSGIGDFIDQPVKNYSSGMMLRLAFAVQTQVDPDILIVDEALAVGDAQFQVKCFERLKQLKDNGTSILLVTHTTEQIINHCSQAVLLNNGAMLEHGNPKAVVNRYLDILFGKERKSELAEKLSSTTDIISQVTGADTVDNSQNSGALLSFTEDRFSTRSVYNPHEYRWGSGSALILDFFIESNNEVYPTYVTSGEKVKLGIACRFLENVFRPILGITLRTKEGILVYGTNTELWDCTEFQQLGEAGSCVYVETEFICRLASGDYFISLGLVHREGEEIVPHDRRYDAIHLIVSPTKTFHGLTNLDLSFKVFKGEQE